MKIRDRNDKFLSLSNFYLRKIITLGFGSKKLRSQTYFYSNRYSKREASKLDATVKM